MEMAQLIVVAVACLGLYVWSSTAVLRILTANAERLPRVAREILPQYPPSKSRSTRVVSIAIHAAALAGVQWLMGSVLVDAIAHGDVVPALITAGEWLGAATWTAYLANTYLAPPMGSAH